MIYTYKTIDKISQGIFKDKGSKFIAIAIPVNCENDIKQKVKEIKSEYYDARHHCYAYILNPEADVYRANDDGEPTNTAGKPILSKINHYKLTNILIIVTRYFGGVLLGKGGLINAYGNAAEIAINNSNIIENKIYNNYKISFNYEIANDVFNFLKLNNIDQDSIKYNNENVEITFKIWNKYSENIIEKLLKISNIEIN